ncbi:MAG: phosphoglycerate kinase [Candidatus Paceibacterota bacterium]
MKTLREVGNLKDKKVLFRADFDVPVSDKGQIEESFRIKKQKETLDYLVGQGAKVVMVAHISDESVGQSFSSLLPQLHILLGYEISFIKNVSEIGSYLENYAGPALLENVRQFPGEKENDLEFAKQLASGFDIYVNNAFAVCHRDHASVSGVTKFLPSYAGLVIEEEVARLSEVANSPKEGKIIVMGGAKAETKVPVIKNFIDKAEKILLGGVVAHDFFKKKGMDIGNSVFDENYDQLLAGLDVNDPKLVMADDYNIFENRILDLGPESIKRYVGLVKEAKTIIWNGPMGMFEDERFIEGTKAIAQAIADSNALKIVGGGDTIAAIDKFGLEGKFDFVSTGGGAMLAFLAGEKMPGLEALGYYD